MIDRRALVLAGAGWLGVSGAAIAQATARKRRIAYLGSGTAETSQHLTEIFRAGLRDLGWIEGDNLILDIRFAESDPARASSLTAELLALKPDVFVSSTDREARDAAAATRSVPIVFGRGVDPVGLGLVVGSPGRERDRLFGPAQRAQPEAPFPSERGRAPPGEGGGAVSRG